MMFIAYNTFNRYFRNIKLLGIAPSMFYNTYIEFILKAKHM